MSKHAILERADNSKEVLGTWYTRQDEDISRYLLERYVWKNTKGEKMPDVEHVTLNDPRTFADRIIYQLGTAEKHYDFLSEDDKKASEAERFVKFLMKEADDALMFRGEWGVEEFDDWGTVMRGALARRVLLKTDGVKWDVDIQSVDARVTSWEVGTNGYDLVNFWGEKTPDEARRDLDVDVSDKKSVSFNDIWTPTRNYVFIDGKAHREVEHGLSSNPAFVVKCPTTPLIAKRSDAVRIMAESVYAPVRDLYDLLNKSASGWFTSNIMSILPALQFISKDGRKSKIPPFGIKTVANLRIGEEYKLIGLKDVSMSHQAFFGQIMSRIQRATYSNLDYGDLSFQLSALAIKRMEQAKDQLYIPRLRAKIMMEIWTARTLIKQFIDGGYRTKEELSNRAFEMPFKRSDLLPKFQIQVNYFSQSPDENIADATIAQTYKNLGLPEEYIYKQIVKVDDYQQILEMRDRERALLESQAARKFKYAMSLFDTGDPDDAIQAQLALREIGLTMQWQRAPQESPKQSPSQPNLPLGLTTHPIANRPTVPEQETMTEEQRRQRIFMQERGGQAQTI